jgi:hypothetical protein
MEISVVVYRPQRLMCTQPGVVGGHFTRGCWPSHWVAPADPEFGLLRTDHDGSSWSEAHVCTTDLAGSLGFRQRRAQARR